MAFFFFFNAALSFTTTQCQYIVFTASEQVDPSWFGSNVCFLSVCLVDRPLSVGYIISTWGELLSPLSVHVLLRF